MHDKGKVFIDGLYVPEEEEGWRNENIPGEALEARVALIFKKGESSKRSNYRPISLMNSIYKVMAAVLQQTGLATNNNNNNANSCKTGPKPLQPNDLVHQRLMIDFLALKFALRLGQVLDEPGFLELRLVGRLGGLRQLLAQIVDQGIA